MSAWSEREDVAQQRDDNDATWRDEIASQRNADAHLIWDDRPTRAEAEADDHDDRVWWRERGRA